MQLGEEAIRASRGKEVVGEEGNDLPPFNGRWLEDPDADCETEVLFKLTQLRQKKELQAIRGRVLVCHAFQSFDQGSLAQRKRFLPIREGGGGERKNQGGGDAFPLDLIS